MEKTEKRRRFIINFFFWGIIAALLILLIRRYLGVLTPFITAFLVSALLRPVWTWISDRLRIPKRGAAIVTVLLFYALLVTLLILLANTLFNVAARLASGVPQLYAERVEPALAGAAESLRAMGIDLLGDNFDSVVGEVLGSLGGIASGISKKLLTWAASLAANVPGFLVGVLIAVIATVFAASDWLNIRAFLRNQLPPRTADTIRKIRSHLARVVRSFLRSYLIIMGITFLEVFLGMLLLGIPRAPLIAMGVAVFDILPILGTGMILVPWGVVSLLNGLTARGIGLIALYLVIAAIRNYIEPRIVGHHMGLHPLLTLFSMVVGTYVFGGVGLLGLPITLAVLKSLQEAGLLHFYNDGNPPPAALEEAPPSADPDAAAAESAELPSGEPEKEDPEN